VQVVGATFPGASAGSSPENGCAVVHRRAVSPAPPRQ
jgi:hypothetical protein